MGRGVRKWQARPGITLVLEVQRDLVCLETWSPERLEPG